MSTPDWLHLTAPRGTSMPLGAAISTRDVVEARELMQKDNDSRSRHTRSAAAREDDWSLDEQFADLLTTIAGALSLTSAALLGIASLWMLSL